MSVSEKQFTSIKSEFHFIKPLRTRLLGYWRFTTKIPSVLFFYYNSGPAKKRMYPREVVFENESERFDIIYVGIFIFCFIEAKWIAIVFLFERNSPPLPPPLVYNKIISFPEKIRGQWVKKIASKNRIQIKPHRASDILFVLQPSLSGISFISKKNVVQDIHIITYEYIENSFVIVVISKPFDKCT